MRTNFSTLYEWLIHIYYVAENTVKRVFFVILRHPHPRYPVIISEKQGVMRKLSYS